MNVVRVSAPVYATEDEEKVKLAITNLFPVDLHLKGRVLYGEGGIECLRELHKLLREQRILDTARGIMLRGVKGNTTEFYLNKQAAFVGKVNFSDEKPTLGCIHVEISAENYEKLMKIIQWLAPSTIDGKPVEEIELNEFL